MRKKIYLLLLLFTWNFCSAQTNSFHDIIPEPPNPPSLVSDLGGILSKEEEVQLENKLEMFEKETSNEVAVVTLDTLGYMEVSEFALELARKWNIGKASKKNGVLLLVSKKDRKINISVSDHLQGALTDHTCGKIIRDSIVPEFRAGNYFTGLDKATNGIIAATRGEFTNDEPKKGGTSIAKILIILAILLFIIFISNQNRKRTYVSRRGYRNKDDDWGGGWFGGFGGGSFGGGSWGGGSSGGGGGFGGFGGGGGGFDGGGSSGSW